MGRKKADWGKSSTYADRWGQQAGMTNDQACNDQGNCLRWFSSIGNGVCGAVER